jgi:3-hydroxybutyryl-CoA dehydrogenase
MLRKIGVIGAGMTGQGISWCAAQNGIDVIFKEVNQEAVDEALKSLSAQLDNEIERWALTKSEKAVILSRVRGTTRYEDLADCQFIIESIPDTLDAKKILYQDAESCFPPEVPVASNTSVLSISELASHLKNPHRMVGMHFLNPVHRRPLVEIVRGLNTSEDAVRKAREFGEAIGKTCVEVFESPGYVTTRLIIPFVNEAMTLVMEGIANAADVDAAMRLGYDFPMGPLEIADRAGLDEIMFWMEELFSEFGSARYRPNTLLRKMVRAGQLGVKTGQGFFKYDRQGRRMDNAG